MSPAEREVKLAANRALLSDWGLAEVAWARTWAQTHLRPRTTLNHSVNSYGLKQFAEDDRVCCPGGYLCNGAMIAGMLLAGFTMERDPRCNPVFSVSDRLISASGLASLTRALGIDLHSPARNRRSHR
jgi:hypothetical protein